MTKKIVWKKNTNGTFDSIGTKEHSFLKQIRDAKVTDVEKAALCSLIANGKTPFTITGKLAGYVMGLIHLEWRGFNELKSKTDTALAQQNRSMQSQINDRDKEINKLKSEKAEREEYWKEREDRQMTRMARAGIRETIKDYESEKADYEQKIEALKVEEIERIQKEHQSEKAEVIKAVTEYPNTFKWSQKSAEADRLCRMFAKDMLELLNRKGEA
jgi:hypothetical protein